MATGQGCAPGWPFLPRPLPGYRDHLVMRSLSDQGQCSVLKVALTLGMSPTQLCQPLAMRAWTCSHAIQSLSFLIYKTGITIALSAEDYLRHLR